MAYSSQINFHKIYFPSEENKIINKIPYHVFQLKSYNSCTDSRAWSLDEKERSQHTYDTFMRTVKGQGDDGLQGMFRYS